MKQRLCNKCYQVPVERVTCPACIACIKSQVPVRVAIEPRFVRVPKWERAEHSLINRIDRGRA